MSSTPVPATFGGGQFASEQARELFESRFWQKSYPEGTPKEIGPLKHAGILDVLEASIDQFADRVAFVSAGVEITYEEVGKKATAFAAYLQGRGIKKGDVVAVMLPNCFQFPICILGAMKAGAIFTAVNPLYTPRELNHQLKDSGAKTIVVFESFAHTLQQSLEGTQVRDIIVTQLGDLLGGALNIKGRLINYVLRNVKKMVPEYELPNAVWIRDALSEGASLPLNRATTHVEDIALLQYTGGTTGLSKGAMLTNFSLLSNMEQGMTFIKPALGEGDHTILTLLPLYHIYAMAVNCMTFMILGARNVLIANPRDISLVVKTIKNEKISTLTAVNTLFNAFMENEDFRNRDFSDLKFAMSGGMALQKAIAERWHTLTGVPIVEGYGMTETSPVISVPPLFGVNLPVFRGNVGLPIPGCDVRLRRTDGLWADLNEPGEICVRGPQVMKGYWNRPDATTEMIDADGWLATGDIGEMDADGYLKIVDRKKDMIIVSGFNVFPNEIEDVVAMHPGVLECGAVGVPDEITGEQVKICVVKRDPSLMPKDIIEHCRKHLTGYKVPKFVEFWQEIPKTPVGKVLRRELRVKKPS
jgi:long-chain acyl-CoA synthetase